MSGISAAGTGVAVGVLLTADAVADAAAVVGVSHACCENVRLEYAPSNPAFPVAGICTTAATAPAAGFTVGLATGGRATVAAPQGAAFALDREREIT